MWGMPQTSTRICAGALRPATSVLTCRALPSGSGFSRAMAVEVSSAAQIAAPKSFWMTRLKSVFIVGAPFVAVSCSLDGAQRNPGIVPCRTPDFAALHPGYEILLALALVAREHALHRPRPARQLPLPCRLAHVRLEAVLEAPVVGEFCRLGIDAGLEAREIGGAQRRRLLDHRAIDRGVEQVGEALHGPVGRGHAAVDAEHDARGFRARPVRAHGGPKVERLVADTFEGGVGELGRAGVAGEAEQGAADARIPVRRAHADEGRDQID